MKSIKILSTLFLLSVYSILSHAAPAVDTEHQFFKIHTTTDGASVYIGAFGEYLPRVVNLSGDVLIRAMVLQNVASKDHEIGEQYEYVVLANCTDRVAKIIVVGGRKKAGAPISKRFELIGEELEQAMTDTINSQSAAPIEEGSMLLMAVSAGCQYVGNPLKDDAKPKVQELEI